ncbi:MAG TPA: FHA domain-containing protein [Candidatus Omnitrophota bacterium]|nr:FHA domain-containing protein [Candidatus Omnitrophota bacterium]HQO57692.1 FHA domain-containing protein [Candidatus Omnitrophota bacterium]HQP12817.1 FHA domain-containing protein [Candidatus Omnitrophota bacterium]
MAKIVLEIALESRPHKEVRVFDSDRVTVGRGFDNDVILADPYVSSRHMVVERIGESVRIRDTGSENGTCVAGVTHRGEDVEIPSGAEIVIGKTRLRVYHETHPVAPARRLVENNAFLKLTGHPVFAWALVLAVAGLALLEAHWGTTRNENLLKLLPAPIGVLSSVLVWAGFWTFIGRLLRHKMYFWEHVSICCLWFLASELMDNGIHYTAFYVNSKTIGLVLGYTVNSGLFIAVLFATLTFAANMTSRKKIIFAGVFTGVIVLSFAGLWLSISEYYAWEPPYDTVLKPPVFGVRPGCSISDFVGRADRLFEFKAFQKGNGTG